MWVTEDAIICTPSKISVGAVRTQKCGGRLIASRYYAFANAGGQ